MAIYEQPKYHVIKKEGPFELRDYEGFTTSSVESKQLNDSSGFGVLFNYISGKNADNQKMKMTVPVIKDFQQNSTSFEFVIPEAHREKLPKPQDPIIYFKHYPDHKAAVYRFKGQASTKLIQAGLEKLNAWILENGWTPVSTHRLMQYQPPFLPGFLRKNEISIEVT